MIKLSRERHKNSVVNFVTNMYESKQDLLLQHIFNETYQKRPPIIEGKLTVTELKKRYKDFLGEQQDAALLFRSSLSMFRDVQLLHPSYIVANLSQAITNVESHLGNLESAQGAIYHLAEDYRDFLGISPFYAHNEAFFLWLLDGILHKKGHRMFYQYVDYDVFLDACWLSLHGEMDEIVAVMEKMVIKS